MVLVPAPGRILVVLLTPVLLVGLAAWAGAAQAAGRPVKAFAIQVAETEHELFPGGPRIQAWAFNGPVPGPVLRVIEGDLVRVRFTNARC